MKLHPKNLTGKLYKFYTYDFIKHPGKNRVVSVLKKFFKNGIEVIDDETQTRYILNINDLLCSIILEYGHYEEHSIKIARELCSESDGFFLDVGANFGLYTCYLLSANPKLKSISFDASYLAFAQLLRNISLNKLNNRVQLSNTALSNSFGLHFFSPFNESNLGSSRIVSENSDKSKYVVCSTTLNDVLAELKPSRVRLMKMDVEGHEEYVLNGLDLFGPYRPENILLEYEPVNNPEVVKIKNKLVEANYEVFDVFLNKYSDQMELPESNLMFKSKY